MSYAMVSKTLPRRCEYTMVSKLFKDIDFQHNPDDEEDIRSSEEYMNDLEIELHERDLLSTSKRFFKKGPQRFSSVKETEKTKCYKCGRTGHFAKDCFSKTLIPSYSSPFQNRNQPKFITSSQEHKPKLRPQKEFETKYNNIKAKLAIISVKSRNLDSTRV
ncbi:retrovirus-related pol polyprotein from transposon TNT 1-94 [Tanacetum coccineum]